MERAEVAEIAENESNPEIAETAEYGLSMSDDSVMAVSVNPLVRIARV